jgi:hypothetical protein
VVLRVDAGEEPVHLPVVEGTVVVGQVAVGFRKVMAVQLSEIAEHRAMRSVDDNEGDWSRQRTLWGGGFPRHR